MITVVPLDTAGLGDRNYVAHDGEVALVVDPQRDYDRVLAITEDAGVRITHVFETHVHNDYVSGGLALAREVGAAYHLNADDDVAFERDRPARRRRGRGRRDAPAGAPHPGHTHTHLSYVLEDVAGAAQGAFTGGSLLFGSTGRPDLLGADHTDTLVRDQWRSAHRLADALPDATEVYPTHGFGSFCSATQSERRPLQHRRRARDQPRPDQGARDLRRASCSPGSAPTPPTTPTCRRPTPPAPARRASTPPRAPTRPSCAAGSRRASGSSTCAPARPSPPRTCPAPSTSVSTGRSSPTSAG